MDSMRRLNENFQLFLQNFCGFKFRRPMTGKFGESWNGKTPAIIGAIFAGVDQTIQVVWDASFLGTTFVWATDAAPFRRVIRRFGACLIDLGLLT
uniref:Uncharacterized protein n=1 Tax=Panagrolaimus sp. JU765 TaxID=591449 RepID=A0AC34QV66_9BILA